MEAKGVWMNSKAMVFGIVAATVLFAGCANKTVPAPGGETDVGSTYQSDEGDSSLGTPQLKPKTKETSGRSIEIGGSASATETIKRLCSMAGRSCVVIGEDFNLTGNQKLGSIKDVIDYVAATKAPYMISTARHGKFETITIEKKVNLPEKLKTINYSVIGTVNVLNEMKDIAARGGFALVLDNYSTKVFSSERMLSFRGSVNDFFEQMCDAENLYYVVEDNKINIRQYDEQVFSINITPLSMSASANASLAGEGGENGQMGGGVNGAPTISTANNMTGQNGMASAGSGSASSSLTLGYKIYDELADSIKNIAGENGSYSLNKASGQLFVRAKKQNMEVIKKIVSDFNAIYTRMVEVHVEIIEVGLNKNSQNGIDIEALRSGLAATLAGSVSSITGTPNSIVINRDVGGGVMQTNLRAAISLLNQYGTTNVMSSPVVRTLNSIPAFATMAVQQDYLDNISQTAAATTTQAATTQTTKGVANDGVSLYIYPRITADDQIILTIQPKVNKVLSIVPFSPGPGTQIQNLTRDNKDLLNTIIIENGASMIISGLSTNYDNNTKQGMPWVGHEDSWSDFVGGSRAEASNKKEILIFVTANIIGNTSAR